MGFSEDELLRKASSPLSTFDGSDLIREEHAKLVPARYAQIDLTGCIS